MSEWEKRYALVMIEKRSEKVNPFSSGNTFLSVLSVMLCRVGTYLTL